MAFVQWQDSYSVGITAIDLQHKQLIAMINQLAEAMRQGKGDAVVQSILPSLVQYSKTHFNSEEKLLCDVGYPQLAAHQAIHHKFVQHIGDLVEKVKGGKMVATVSVATFLKDWLVNHILVQDKQYAAYIAQRQPVGAAR
jgi:hemerythrin-like metal-binding protein